MANGTLSNYFEQERIKAAKKAGGASVYSAPADAGGTSPTGGGSAGGPSAPSAPKSAAGGGTGFVSFGQYFGANAPAIQQQAQQAVTKAKGAPQASLNAPVGATGLGSFRPTSFGPVPTAQTMVQRQQDPLARQIGQAQRQAEALQPLASYGDMGKDVSAFDQLLGGGLTQRAAKQEQQRLGSLRGYLEELQTQYAQEEASRRAQEDVPFTALWSPEERDRQKAEYYRQKEEERKYYEALRAQQEQAASMDYENADPYDYGSGGY